MYKMTGKEELDSLLRKINQGESINVKSDVGNTALMLAAWYGMRSLLKDLIADGAGLDFKNNLGETALMAAVLGTDAFQCVSLLLEAGANPNLQDNNGNTALLLNIFDTNISIRIKILKLLIEAGADINIKNKSGIDLIKAVNDAWDGLFLQYFNEMLKTVKFKELESVEDMGW